MAVTKTKAQAHAYMNKLVGKGWDFDNAYGWQCFDLVNFYWNYLTGGQLYGLYAKDIPFKNNFNGLATIYENTPSFLPQKGDIVVWNGNWGEGAGHVAIVQSANINTFVSLDQNWWGGGANKTEVAQYISHTYDFPMYFIRPHYKAKSTVKDKVTSVVKPNTKPKTKKKFVLVAGHGYNDPGATGNGTNERDFIRKNIIDNVAKYLRQAGHTVTLYDKKQDMYQDTAYGYNRGDKKKYGLYWVKNKLKPDGVIEFHLDSASPSASGGHVIKNAYAADSIDKGLQKALEETVGTIRGITTRNDLLNANVAYSENINYRLIEMGFITSKKDMNYIKNNLQAFTKRLAEGIHGKPIGGSAAGNKKKITWKWAGRFTANTLIKVRKNPGLKGKQVPKSDWIQAGQWVDFISVTKKDGYWWVRFKYPTNPNAGYFYCAVCKITDKEEKIKKEKYWGKIKWKK
ncbi:N-acetylmuramoyl-L-alanine amidase [Mammaliicoccus lentus]|uniref:N-acetylmuramoyl-L-alanine amidase n=1 Tax=Mammaliicoccus lentus TaxID=42858 RepID=UPI0010729E81|nr:N-acetylmuramoyl-L-alanine amidase [Mammaliicoccus lentus]MBF0749721.1 N-acetylmuramoyl-L-alanine amidase [Mammaliicoccus lentus]TFU57386.1 CHAP domain-containing protein [Mammaliicoccus lentus]